MDELGFNKIAAAILATALGYMGIKELAHAMIHVEAPAKPVYALAIPEASGPAEEIELPFPQAEWVGAMNADRGAKVFKKCTSCHNADNGGPNGTGPNLWNVVGQPAAQNAGFSYSGAFKSSDTVWTYESLDKFLERPSKYISGTAMNFVGLKKPNDRAAVIEYLRIAADTSIPRPEAAAVPVPEEAAIEDTTAISAEAPDTEATEPATSE